MIPNTYLKIYIFSPYNRTRFNPVNTNFESKQSFKNFGTDR